MCICLVHKDRLKNVHLGVGISLVMSQIRFADKQPRGPNNEHYCIHACSGERWLCVPLHYWPFRNRSSCDRRIPLEKGPALPWLQLDYSSQTNVLLWTAGTGAISVCQVTQNATNVIDKCTLFVISCFQILVCHTDGIKSTCVGLLNVSM